MFPIRNAKKTKKQEQKGRAAHNGDATQYTSSTIIKHKTNTDNMLHGRFPGQQQSQFRYYKFPPEQNKKAAHEKKCPCDGYHKTTPHDTTIATPPSPPPVQPENSQANLGLLLHRAAPSPPPFISRRRPRQLPLEVPGPAPGHQLPQLRTDQAVGRCSMKRIPLRSLRG